MREMRAQLFANKTLESAAGLSSGASQLQQYFLNFPHVPELSRRSRTFQDWLPAFVVSWCMNNVEHGDIPKQALCFTECVFSGFVTDRSCLSVGWFAVGRNCQYVLLRALSLSPSLPPLSPSLALSLGVASVHLLTLGTHFKEALLVR